MQGRLKRSYRIASELARNDAFEGTVALGEFGRLAQQLLTTDGVATLSFTFGRTEFGHPMIRGRVSANVEVECQRCLEPMTLDLDLDFELLIDAGEDDVESYALDSVYSQDGYLDVFELVEDELLLGLPLVQMHQDESCNRYWQPRQEALAPEKAANNPFTVLSALKSKD